jgi:hypothetical protein
MSRITRYLLLLVATFALAACGFTGNLRMNPGFASFRSPTTIGQTNRQFAISLGPIPLRLATMISRPVLGREEPRIPETLSAIRAVRVNVYDIDGDAEKVHRHVETTRSELIEDGWELVAVVREDGGLVSALVMNENPEIIDGMVVIFQDAEELVLVNVIGDIVPETFSTIMAGLDIKLPVIDIIDG